MNRTLSWFGSCIFLKDLKKRRSQGPGVLQFECPTWSLILNRLYSLQCIKYVLEWRLSTERNNKVPYMTSSFWLLGVESRDFSHVEKELLGKLSKFKRWQLSLLKMVLAFWVKKVVILWICPALQAVLSFSAWEKSRDSTPNSKN